MEKNRHSTKSVWLALAVALAIPAPSRAQNTGVLLFTEAEQIPLKAYAEFLPAGILRLTSGSEQDIPTIDTFRFVRCSITGWQPAAVLAASEALFRSEYAERRLLPIATRPVGVTAVAVRVADLERPERIADLHKAIGEPEGGDNAYFFLVLTSGGITRYYPFRIRQPAPQP
jgi:hypothetical protein